MSHAWVRFTSSFPGILACAMCSFLACGVTNVGPTGSSWSFLSVALQVSFTCFPSPPIVSTRILVGSRWTQLSPRSNEATNFTSSDGGFAVSAFDYYTGNFTLALSMGGNGLLSGSTYRVDLSGFRNFYSIQSAKPVYIQTFNAAGRPTCGLLQNRSIGTSASCQGMATLADSANGSSGPFALSLFSVAAAGQSNVAPLAGSNIITVTLQPLVDLDDSFKFVISNMFGLRTDLQAYPVNLL